MDTTKEAPGLQRTTDLMVAAAEEIARLNSDLRRTSDQLRRVRAELQVRTHCPGFPERPEEHRYTRTDCFVAYNAGYRQAARESAEEIARLLQNPT
jgi:hypothetical protein